MRADLLAFLIQTTSDQNQPDDQRRSAENRWYRVRGLFVGLKLEIAYGGDVLRLIRGKHRLSKRKKAKQSDNRANNY